MPTLTIDEVTSVEIVDGCTDEGTWINVETKRGLFTILLMSATKEPFPISASAPNVALACGRPE